MGFKCAWAGGVLAAGPRAGRSLDPADKRAERETVWKLPLSQQDLVRCL